jgi:hypothetical protein
VALTRAALLLSAAFGFAAIRSYLSAVARRTLASRYFREVFCCRCLGHEPSIATLATYHNRAGAPRSMTSCGLMSAPSYQEYQGCDRNKQPAKAHDFAVSFAPIDEVKQVHRGIVGGLLLSQPNIHLCAVPGRLRASPSGFLFRLALRLGMVVQTAALPPPTTAPVSVIRLALTEVARPSST